MAEIRVFPNIFTSVLAVPGKKLDADTSIAPGATTLAGTDAVPGIKLGVVASVFPSALISVLAVPGSKLEATV